MNVRQDLNSHRENNSNNQTSAIAALSCWIVGCLAGQGLIEVNRGRDETSQDLFEAVWLVCDCLTAYDIHIADMHRVPTVQNTAGDDHAQS